MDAKGSDGEDIDWLEEGFEGPDFNDDVFENVDDGPSTHDGVSVNAAAPHRPFKGDDGPSTHDGGSVNAAASHRPFEGDDGPFTHEDPTAPHRTTIAVPPLEEGEWADPPFEDDMECLAGFDDDQPAPIAAKEPEFNT